MGSSLAQPNAGTQSRGQGQGACVLTRDRRAYINTQASLCFIIIYEIVSHHNEIEMFTYVYTSYMYVHRSRP